MKKFLVPLFLLLLLSCSNEGFESKLAASSQKDSFCGGIRPDDPTYCPKISESLCKEIGGTLGKCTPVSSSSDVDDVSSSSDADDVSSSSDVVGVSSSSDVSGVGSSSSVVGGDVSSSSDIAGVSSSSDVADVSSSSDVGGSSSSVDVGDVSSSSIDSPSSSSVSQPAPTWTECNIPQYVGRNEPIASLKFISIENNNGRCTMTYKLGSSSSNATTLNYSSSAIGTTQNLTITTSATCNGGITLQPQPCNKMVTVADYLKTETGVNFILKPGKTIIEVVGLSGTMVFGCQARDNSGSDQAFGGKTSFILNEVIVSVTDNDWWVKTQINTSRILFESNNENVGDYRCQIDVN